ncbi:acyltransferase family protein [Endozoicomonas sp. 4G]|uniref:acyltransferase family protein n=1 Tax=Endozoicomonas sp. 4G TaxID=2872754 RepID=UPI00207851DF|nr:acyltransferase family protein [Endozoicomonas sp. 4G]
MPISKRALLPTKNEQLLYVNPLGQLYLFTSGVFLGMAGDRLRGRKNNNCLLIFFSAFLLFMFVFFPVSGGQINLVVGNTRLVLSLICVLFVFVVFLMDLKVVGWIGKFLLFLGETCYSIYLIHPLVALPLAKIFKIFLLDEKYSYLFSIVIVFVLSSLSYKFIERPSIKKAKALSVNLVSDLKY